MGNNTHEDVARRWVNRILYPGRDPLSSRNLLDRGDRIFSYGTHFEVGRILRDRKGEPQAWLLNGDRWPGVVTTRHQNEVRSAVAGHDMPVVTIPHQALDAAGIDLGTVEILDVQRDWWTTRVITKEHLVGSWEYEYDYADKGGWKNSLTNEFVERTSYWGEGSTEPVVECDHEIVVPGPWNTGYDGAPRWNWEYEVAQRKAREVHIRARHGVWDGVSPHRRNTGRKTAQFSTNISWDLIDDPTAPLGYVFEREVTRHWLGGSLIKAQVPYRINVKHKECGGTGLASEPWFTRGGNEGLGPLDEDATRRNEEHWAWQRERFERNGYWSVGRAIYEHEVIPYWKIEVAIEHTECRGCRGRGTVSADRRRTAYFLSGFDENETRPSYFFCELPPKVKPTTVEEAIETLKPSAVKLAEEAGREVKRQGDIFAVPMPGVTLRELKAQSGRHEKRGNLLGTNHAATEVVYVGKQTYARGTIRHVPEFRRPDHKALTIGRDWHLILKNTVPVGS